MFILLQRISRRRAGFPQVLFQEDFRHSRSSFAPLHAHQYRGTGPRGNPQPDDADRSAGEAVARYCQSGQRHTGTLYNRRSLGSLYPQTADRTLSAFAGTGRFDHAHGRSRKDAGRPPLARPLCRRRVMLHHTPHRPRASRRKIPDGRPLSALRTIDRTQIQRFLRANSQNDSALFFRPETGCRQFLGAGVVFVAHGQCRHAPQKLFAIQPKSGYLWADTGLRPIIDGPRFARRYRGIGPNAERPQTQALPQRFRAGNDGFGHGRKGNRQPIKEVHQGHSEMERMDRRFVSARRDERQIQGTYYRKNQKNTITENKQPNIDDKHFSNHRMYRQILDSKQPNRHHSC